MTIALIFIFISHLCKLRFASWKTWIKHILESTLRRTCCSQQRTPTPCPRASCSTSRSTSPTSASSRRALKPWWTASRGLYKGPTNLWLQEGNLRNSSFILEIFFVPGSFWSRPRWKSRQASTGTRSATTQTQRKREQGERQVGAKEPHSVFAFDAVGEDFTLFFGRYSSNVDTKMVQLNFHNDENEAIGILNWFAVHPTSMNKTNRLISGGRFYFKKFHLSSKYKVKK